MAGVDAKPEQQVITQVWELVEPVLNSEGKELLEVEYRREAQGWVLRLFIDQESGISVEDCARVSLVVGDLLDVADFIRNPYRLEVSSPGLNRPLRKMEHYSKHRGKTAELKTAVPIVGNRRNFKGIIRDIHPGQVTIECDGQVFEIPLASVERARLCYFESNED